MSSRLCVPLWRHLFKSFFAAPPLWNCFLSHENVLSAAEYSFILFLTCMYIEKHIIFSCSKFYALSGLPPPWSFATIAKNDLSRKRFSRLTYSTYDCSCMHMWQSFEDFCFNIEQSICCDHKHNIVIQSYTVTGR